MEELTDKKSKKSRILQGKEIGIGKVEQEDIASMIAKVELSKEIARIALACPNCNGPIRDEIIRLQKSKQMREGSHVSSNDDENQWLLRKTITQENP